MHDDTSLDVNIMILSLKRHSNMVDIFIPNIDSRLIKHIDKKGIRNKNSKHQSNTTNNKVWHWP